MSGVPSSYEASPVSVQHALAELQLKTRLLEEERDYYLSLAHNSKRSFEEHRAELNSLLAKERDHFRRREDSMQAELQLLLSDNAAMQSRVLDYRSQMTVRLNEELRAFQQETLRKESEYRREMKELHDELMGLRREHSAAAAQKDAADRGLSATRAAQDAMQRHVRELTSENQELMVVAAAASLGNRLVRNPSARDASPRGRPVSKRVCLPFVPSSCGKAASLSGSRTVLQSTHNSHALVQAARRTCLQEAPLSEGGHVPFSKLPQGKQLDAICRSIVAEILELRSQYDAICRTLTEHDDGASGDGGASIITDRLRMLFGKIDTKTEQLRALKRSQRELDSTRRLDSMLVAVQHENDGWLAKHAALMRVIRTSSFAKDGADVDVAATDTAVPLSIHYVDSYGSPRPAHDVSPSRWPATLRQ